MYIFYNISVFTSFRYFTLFNALASWGVFIVVGFFFHFKFSVFWINFHTSFDQNARAHPKGISKTKMVRVPMQKNIATAEFLNADAVNANSRVVFLNIVHFYRRVNQ